MTMMRRIVLIVVVTLAIFLGAYFFFNRVPHPRPRPPAQRVRRDNLFENAHRASYVDTYDVPT